jgi:hypothetical protein
VVHLAAQAGVRYSIEHPDAYVDANLQGFGNVLEGCRHNQRRHLLYASSSSVYGANAKLPFSVGDNTDYPGSFCAAAKKANQMMAYSYSHLYHLPVTGLDSLQSTDRRAGPTCLFSCSPERSSRAGRSSFLTMARREGISPISGMPTV